MAKFYDYLKRMLCDSFKSTVEAICECPDIAESLYNDAAEKLQKAEEECDRCNERLDAKGGPHGH